MRAYIIAAQSIDDFIARASSPAELDLDAFDDQVRPATVQIIARPQLNYFVESYSLILQDRGIDVSSDSTTKALDKATRNACAWFAVSGAAAPALAQQLEGVTITEEDTDTYLGISDDDHDLQELRKLHLEFTEAVRQIGTSQMGLFRADL